jgi:TGS domain
MIVGSFTLTIVGLLLQPKGQVPDYEEPVILRAENPTIEEFCNRLHKGLLAEFSHAWVCTYLLGAWSGEMPLLWSVSNVSCVLYRYRGS